MVSLIGMCKIMACIILNFTHLTDADWGKKCFLFQSSIIWHPLWISYEPELWLFKSLKFWPFQATSVKYWFFYLTSDRCFSSTGEASSVDEYLWLMGRANYKPVIEYCGGTEIGGGFVTGTLLQFQSLAAFSTPAMGCTLFILDSDGNPLVSITRHSINFIRMCTV